MIGASDVSRLIRELEVFRKSINNLAEVMKHNNKLIIEHGRIMLENTEAIKGPRLKIINHSDECEKRHIDG